MAAFQSRLARANCNMATTPKLELPPTTNLAGVNDDADSTVEVGADRDQRLLDEKKSFN